MASPARKKTTGGARGPSGVRSSVRVKSSLPSGKSSRRGGSAGGGDAADSDEPPSGRQKLAAKTGKRKRPGKSGKKTVGERPAAAVAGAGVDLAQAKAFRRGLPIAVKFAVPTSLALAFSERHRAALARFDSVVVVVCGGSGVNWEIMEGWRDLL